MSRYIPEEHTILYHFAFRDHTDTAKHQAYARYIINLVDSGQLPAGTVIPSVKILYRNNDCSTHTINRALKVLQTKGYLLIVTGKRSVIQHPEITAIPSEQAVVRFHGNHQCLFSPVYTDKLNKHMFKIVTEHQRKVPAGEQNSIFPEFLYVLALRFNQFHHQKFSQDKIYYMQDLHLLMTVIVKVIQEKNKGVVIVSKNCQVIIPAILKAHGFRVIEVSVESDGLSVNELDDVARNHQIAAVMFMSRANYPHGINTSQEKIIKLLKLCKKYGFQIIDINTAEPWLASKRNYLIELAGDAMDAVIYIYTVSLLVYHACEIYGIASHQDNILLIRNFAKALGKKAERSLAYATCQLMGTYEFKRIEEEMTRAMSDMKLIAADLIRQSGFWKLDGIAEDNGDTVFLVPKSGSFPTDVFDRLIAEQIRAVNTNLYTKQGADVAGIRFEMAHYVQNKSFSRKFESVLKVCERMVS